MPVIRAADPRYNLTDPAVLAPLEVTRLGTSVPWLAGIDNLASQVWATTPDGLIADMHGAIFRYNTHTGVYTMSAHPVHQVWIGLGQVQRLLAAEVLVEDTPAAIDAYLEQHRLTLFILEDNDCAAAQLVSFLLMRGVSQTRPDHNLIVDVAQKVLARAATLYGA